MILDEKWKIKNKLYKMKDKKIQLERFIKNSEPKIEILKKVNFFKRYEDESFLFYICSIMFLIFLKLDMIVEFYYRRYVSFKNLKLAKKEIETLTKDIEQYERY
jgi:hypothetical protein